MDFVSRMKEEYYPDWDELLVKWKLKSLFALYCLVNFLEFYEKLFALFSTITNFKWFYFLRFKIKTHYSMSGLKFYPNLIM